MKKLFIMLLVLATFVNTTFAKGIETTYRNALIFAYSAANNVYEDDNIRLEIYNEQLWATNKTQKTIFIDLSQCFLYHNGTSRPMFTNDIKERNASRKGTSTSIDEFITIVPNNGSKQNDTFICSLTEAGFYGEYSTTENPAGDFTEYDKRLLNVINDLVTESMKADPKGKECKGTVSRHLTEDESINSIGASVAYAFNKRSEDWITISISSWVSDVILTPYFVVMPQDIKKKEMKGFGVKESAPAEIHVRANSPFDFEQDKSPIIVADWEGNFKKGTFKLTTTRISKTKGMTAAFLGMLVVGPAALASISEQYYKSVISFDGITTDWGKMTYSPISDPTKTSKKK